MYGDLDAIRRRAGQLREQAVDVRALAERLVTHSDGIDWQGRAADTMRARMRDRAEQLRDSAERHDRAADALERHAGEVARLREEIDAVEHRVRTLVDDAQARAERLRAQDVLDPVRRVPSEQDRRLLDFVPPPPGHKDWLTVEIGGR